MKFLFFTIVSIIFLPTLIFSQQANTRDQGIELYRQGEFEKAVQILRNRTEIEVKDRLAWVYLGAAYVKLNKTQDAINAFTKSDVIYKENIPVYEKKLDIRSKPQPRYTQEARKKGTSGSIRLAVEFGADGKIGFVFPINELSDGLTEQAIEASKAIEFKSAVIDGKPVTVVSIVSYSFSVF